MQHAHICILKLVFRAALSVGRHLTLSTFEAPPGHGNWPAIGFTKLSQACRSHQQPKNFPIAHHSLSAKQVHTQFGERGIGCQGPLDLILAAVLILVQIKDLVTLLFPVVHPRTNQLHAWPTTICLELRKPLREAHGGSCRRDPQRCLWHWVH